MNPGRLRVNARKVSFQPGERGRGKERDFGIPKALLLLSSPLRVMPKATLPQRAPYLQAAQEAEIRPGRVWGRPRWGFRLALNILRAAGVWGLAQVFQAPPRESLFVFHRKAAERLGGGRKGEVL